MVSLRAARLFGFSSLILFALFTAGMGGGCSSSESPSDEAGEGANEAAESSVEDEPRVTTPRRGPQRSPSQTDAANDNRARDTGNQDLGANDRRAREAMERARDEFERGSYDEAMRCLEEVATVQPLSDDVTQALRVQANMTRTFQQALGGVEPLNHRREMVRVIFHDGGSLEGVVLERDRHTLLLRRYAGGYERVDTRPSNVYRVEELSRREQREELARRFATLEERFRMQPRTPVEMARFAREARRYDQPEKAHNLLREAFSLDQWVDESLALEADEDYVAFRHAMQEGQRDRAAVLLRALKQRYPNAALFAKQQPLSAGESEPTEPTTATPEPEPLKEEEAERIIAEAEEQAEQDTQDARRNLRVDPEAEIPDLAEKDADQLLRLADRYRDTAKEHERGTSPEGEDAMDALDKAIYNYRMAQELYRRALTAGADEDLVNPRLTDVNRGLFWARRSRPLD